MALRMPLRVAERLSEAPPVRLAAGRNPRSRLLNFSPWNLTRESLGILEHIREGRFQRTLSLIAGLSSVLSGWEVFTEHYRASYGQRIMYTPIIISPSLLIAGILGMLSKRAARTVLPIVSLITILDGVTGFFFHIRGIARKPGGWRIPVFNITMGPPLLAPLLFGLSGYLGLLASLMRREGEGRSTPSLPVGTLRPGDGHVQFGLLSASITREGVTLRREIRTGHFQKHLAVSAAISAIFSGFESLYSHYQNNFNFKVQWSPIILTPLLFVAGISTIWSRRIGRTLLPAVSIMAMLDGAIGSFYHVRGMMLRRPAGPRFAVRNLPYGPLYSLMYAPPPFAPLLFAASGFLGLLASLMRRED
jgi:hypothetical protein